MLASGAGYFQPLLIPRHPKFCPAILTINQPVVDQPQDFLTVQAHHHIVADEECRYSPHIALHHFIPGPGIFVNILFNIVDLVLRKKLFRRGAVRSGIAGKHGHLFHGFAS